jgi:outer membrane protein OmpA-like peptidoglycan-associated protein
MNFISNLLIALILSTHVAIAAEPPAKAAEPKSQFEENLYSLRDLTGVYVVLDYVAKSSEKSHLSVSPDLEKDIKTRLESVGLKLLTKDEMLKTPGNPELDIFPNYPAHLSAVPDEADPENQAAIPNLMPIRQCCYTSVWGSFSQAAIIERKSDSKYRLSTWGDGSNTDSCDKLGEWMSAASLKIIDQFVADFKKAKELKKKSAATPEIANPSKATPVAATENVQASQIQYVKVKEVDDTKGMTCDTALIVYAQIFKTGATTISTAKEALLDKLASHMLSCRNYRYRIETHSDKPTNNEADEVLAVRRGIALNKFFLNKGVEEAQFEMRFLSDSKAKTKDTEDDVIITPISQ